MSDCRGCGTAIAPTGRRGRPRVWCSDACKPLLGPMHGPRRMVAGICTVCAGAFVGRADQLYCSPLCKGRGTYATKTRITCTRCAAPTGWTVGARKDPSKAICRPCRSAVAVSPGRPGLPRRDTAADPFDVWTCGRCGIRCRRRARKGTRPRYCGQQCQVNAAAARREARERGAFVEEVSPADVFAADGYRCHLCDEMTDPTAVVPALRAPTVDHLIPLAKGGTHERANCRTACFSCNCAKQDRGGGEQFALVLEYEGVR